MARSRLCEALAACGYGPPNETDASIEELLTEHEGSFKPVLSFEPTLEGEVLAELYMLCYPAKKDPGTVRVRRRRGASRSDDVLDVGARAGDLEQTLAWAVSTLYDHLAMQTLSPTAGGEHKKRGAPARNKARNAWIIRQRRRGKTFGTILTELQEQCRQTGWNPVSSAQAIQSIYVKGT
jgi:hypothetical protein